MQSTISPQHQQLLEQHQLARFEQLWDYQGEWFEAPNRERGGWSGVNYIDLTDISGQKKGFYLKRQQAHTRRTWRHPLIGEPTFVREFEILQHLKKHAVKTPTLAFFGTKQNKAILLTEALSGFSSADEWLESHASIDVHQQRKLMRALATAVQRLHKAGVQHRSLYLKHLFVKEIDAGKNDSHFDIAMIDFEKSRITRLIQWLRFSDLGTLHSRTRHISASNKLAFFKHYFDMSKLTFSGKLLCRYLQRQSLQKKR